MSGNYKYYVGLFTSTLTLMFITDLAFAQVPNNGTEAILETFRDIRTLNLERIRDLATNTFYSLMLIEITVSACVLAWNGADLNSFGRWITERFLLSGIMIFLFNFAPQIVGLIEWTVEELGITLGGAPADPSEVLESGVKIAGDLAESVGWWAGASAIPVLLASILLALMFASIAANMAVVLAEIYLISTLGIFLLGFAGGSWTRDYAINYFRWILSVSMKLATMQLIVGLGFTLINTWFVRLSFDDLKNTSMLTLLGTVLVIYTLTKTLPNAMADMVRGHDTGNVGSVRSSASTIGSNAGNFAGKTYNAGAAAISAFKGKENDAKGSENAKTKSGAEGNAAKADKAGDAGKAVKGPSAGRS